MTITNTGSVYGEDGKLGKDSFWLSEEEEDLYMKSPSTKRIFQ